MSGPLVLILRLGMAICLYVFLGWVFIVFWRDLKERGVQLAARKPQPLDLMIQTGSGDSVRRSFLTTQVVLGRDPACELYLDDDAVSARHARMVFHHMQWWLEDLGSTNGTRLNDSRLEIPTVLTSGDQIECGQTLIIVSLGGIREPSPTVHLKKRIE